MKFNKEKPYNDLPLLPPKEEIETKKILKKAISANRALASMAGCCKQLPSEFILYSSLFLQEAKDSSEVENIITTNDELYKAFALDQKVQNPNTREVLYYVDALWEGIKLMKSKSLLTTKIFIEIVNIIKQNKQGVRDFPGTKIVRPDTNEVVYTPPEGKNIILDKLKNLEEYINSDNGVDDLIKMSIIHYQFESIHPFADGNGRTGRIINILYLVLKGHLDHPMLFLSKYIIKNKANYYKNIRAVTEKQDWESWVMYMLDAIEETSRYTEIKINEVIRGMNLVKNEIGKKLPSLYSKDLLEVLFSRPYCKIKFLTEANIVQRNTASKYLKELERIGVLEAVKVGRETLYINKTFYKILND